MKHLLYALFICFTAMACTDRISNDGYNPQLPPETQTGANTFGAIIDGKVMIPRTPTGYTPPGSQKAGVCFTEDKEYCEISVGDSKTQTAYIYIYIKNTNNMLPLKTGMYPIMESNGELSSSVAEHTLVTAFIYKNNKTIYYHSIGNSGSINITRSDADIISGTFSCKLKNEANPADVIDLTSARFDFTKQTIYNTYFP